MIMKTSKIFLHCGVLALTLLTACAKEDKSSSNEQSLQYIEAWVSENYPQHTKTSAGVYILEDSPSDGETYKGEDFVYVSYTVSSLNGDISSTTSEKVAKQLGTYVESNYYGPSIWYTAYNNLSVGVEEAIAGMKVGETRKVLIPSWLMVSERYDDPQEYVLHTNSKSASAIYEVTLERFTNDISETQIADIENFNLKVFGKLDSLHRGVYYKELTAPSDTTKFKKDTTVYINYTGRLLNGRVFDTTIRDTAKKYSIYSSSASYKPIKITWGENLSELKMYTSGSMEGSTPILGFCLTLWNMRKDGTSVGIFTSDYGYGYNGSGNKIPAYAPLLFEIELTQKQ